MLKTRAMSLLLVIIASTSYAGGDLVNNGGGIAEKNIMFAYQRLESFIQLCLSAEQCKVDEAQKEILKKILEGLPQEKENKSQIQFISEKQSPGTFILEGNVKVAKTGSRIGSPIYINTDLIYAKNEIGYYIPTSISESAAILIHELGHHYGPYTHDELDLIGVRLAMLLNNKTYTTPLLPWDQEISATVINSSLDKSFPDILLNIEDKVVDLSSQYKSMINCPSAHLTIPILPLPSIPLGHERPKGSLIHNVHWLTFDKNTDKKTARLTIEANMTHICERNRSKKEYTPDFKLRIDFKLIMNTDGKWQLDENAVKMEQIKDSRWNVIKINPRLRP